MIKRRGGIFYLDRTANIFEVLIAVLLLIVIVIKFFDVGMELIGSETRILHMEFDKVLSLGFSLVIGVEFVRMLCKHTPETVIDVLLFAIARYMILYHEGGSSMLLGVLAIGGLFAIRRFVIGNNSKHSNKTDS